MNDKEIKHLEFIYSRMINVHKENENYDYMLKMKEILLKQKMLNKIINE